MLKTRVAFAAVVMSVCGLLIGGQAFSAAGDGPEYSLVIKKVEVKTTKADGAAWDIMDGKPDLFVRVQNQSHKDSKAQDTKVHDDTTSATFDAALTLKFRAGDKISFEVIDKDVAANDEVGKINVQMDEKQVKEGKIRLENFGQVIYLEVTVKKL